MARITQYRTALRNLVAATLLIAPLTAQSAIQVETYRAVRELRVKAPSRPKLSRVLGRIEKSRKLLDEDVQKRKLTLTGARKVRRNLDVIADRSLSLALNGRDLSEARTESMEWEADRIYRVPSPMRARRPEHRALVAAIAGQ